MEDGNNYLTIIGIIALTYLLYGTLITLLEKKPLRLEPYAALGGFLIIGALLPLAISIEKTGIFITSFLASLSPVITIALGLWNGERLKLRELIGILLAIGSIVVFSVG